MKTKKTHIPFSIIEAFGGNCNYTTNYYITYVNKEEPIIVNNGCNAIDYLTDLIRSKGHFASQMTPLNQYYYNVKDVGDWFQVKFKRK